MGPPPTPWTHDNSLSKDNVPCPTAKTAGHTPKIDLNNYVGNDHGHLIPGGGGFYATADHDATKLEGVVLKTRLAKGGDNGGWRDADLDTDVFIANDHGVFKWVGKKY
ncbi:hypothetical protein M422DRAFT_245867 [Sphaerobolus stellatus SS14]|nr:hypothetical protein M422DRAFT_245867 [Sphaerobolus stellatus SS14]